MAIYRTYTVRRGDTLSGIAHTFATSVAALQELNALPDANRLKVGQTLKVMRVSDTFRVGEAGDTLAHVATRARVDPRTLAQANGGAPLDSDIGGRPIVVPSSAPTAGPVPPPGHKLGQLSAKYECGNRGPGTVSTGRGDSGGASYGQYQLASKKDQPRLFLASAEGSPYAARFARMEQGDSDFTAAWKLCASELGASFGDAQHAYIQRTHYAPQCARIQKRTGVDVTKLSATLRDVVWSTAVQHGSGSDIVADAIAGLEVQPGAADFETRLIDAIYLERGRRNTDGVLVHFAKNSLKVQEGIAARFRSERNDAQAMLSAELVKQTIAAAVLSPPPEVDASSESQEAFLARIASRMSDADVSALLEHYGDDETRADFERGRKVLVSLRRSTDWSQAELGKYDDPMILIWKTGASISVKRFIGNTEPAGCYAFGHVRAARGSSVDFDRDGRCDLGRLRAGVYHFRPEQHPHLGAIWRARDIQVVDRDCNHDGKFTPDLPTSGDKTDPCNAGTTMYIHKGGTSFTGSAGCQTLPPADFDALRTSVGEQPSLDYILINAS
ncbi:LysM peptidoglycan-binding domain-containing protein [Novosphingobium sp. 9U]|uniref:VgrG-related protein n=1 Tax=Novosphingobium sp. 9U TaxID=2653158 RepID=UPI0012F30C30|nr:LysM peptidoglycan-binding domain-containing protein [Novosphingobium sp. 9U]VWX54512.1 conserved hypothetical protein [Novosphingobium sp. 9U]